MTKLANNTNKPISLEVNKIKRDDGSSLLHQTLDDLFDIANTYGMCNIFQFDGGAKRRLCATIYFQTIGGCKLEASSSHDCKSVREALMEAIGKAREIVSHFKSY